MNESILEKIEAVYRFFGCANERPRQTVISPDGHTLNSAGTNTNVLLNDLELLEHVAADPNLGNIIRDCDNLLEKIANRSRLLESITEVDANFDKIAIDSDRTLLGLTLYHYLASGGPALTGEKESVNTISSLASMASATPIWQSGMIQVSSAILRMNLVFTFFRGDSVKSALDTINPNPNSFLDLYRRLFNHEYVRHARNAFAHGHIRLIFAGVYIKDRSFSTLLTPGMIEKLSMWIWMFYYDLFIVYTKRRNSY
jgi:hypothetical protein